MDSIPLNFKRLYKTIHSFISHKAVKIYADVVMILAGGYLSIKKMTDFSLTGWLLNHALHQPAVNFIVFASVAGIGVAVILKVLTLIAEQFPPKKPINTDPDQISECLLRINKEICEHISKCNTGIQAEIRQLNEQHKFQLNMALIVEALSIHIAQSLNNSKVTKKEIFVSLYRWWPEKEELTYVLHHDPKKDWITSKTIKIRNKEFRDYECVKCLESSNTVAYVLKSKGYAKSANKRHKTVKHYIGCKLVTEDYTFGIMNIEFHKTDVFVDEDQMAEFVEAHIMPFKLLIEYQFLKKHFFQSFNNFEQHWRHTA